MMISASEIVMKTNPLTLDDVRNLIERQAQAWVAGNIELALADFAPDALFISPGGRWQGHDAIRRAANAFFAVADDVQVEVTRLLFDGRQGAVEWTWSEMRRETGARHRAEDAIVFELENGKIIYWREYFDTRQMETPVGDDKVRE
jgi:uncharacterized protein (TIGR02246 family)